jgi:hypothetical protein
MMGLMGEIGEI